jgi:alpha-tubulin suppressor-like RCC1 family protein
MATTQSRTIATLALLAFASCYRAKLVDCVLACGSVDGAAVGACPSGMTCSAGLCTRGPTCVATVAAGARHTCALRGDSVACWGNNTYGQIGIGSTAPSVAAADTRPALAIGSRWIPLAVAAGGRHTCALVDAVVNQRTQRGVVCWGDNSLGQLGVPDRQPRGADPADTYPLVSLGPDAMPTAITAGLYHTCALVRGGGVVCWGDNRFGQLGVDTNPLPDGGVAINSPPPPAGGGDPNFDIELGFGAATAISAGAYHTCAVLPDGSVRCWGWNGYGQLGDSSLPSGDTAPGTIAQIHYETLKATAVAAGGFHTCALLEDGEVSCWGQNDAGQSLVVAYARDPAAPAVYITPSPIGSRIGLGQGRSALALTAGATHSCALLDDFTVKCWGWNGEGELGIGAPGNTSDPLTPDGGVRDLVPVALGPDAVGQIAAGSYHTCAVQGPVIKCWGFGGSGRLGLGDNGNRGDGVATHDIAAVRLGAPSP